MERFLGDTEEHKRLVEIAQFTKGLPLALRLFGGYLQSHAVEDLDNLASFSAFGPGRATGEQESEELILAVHP